MAELNERGCSRSTYELYGHVVRDFHRHMGQDLGLKLKRRKTLPPYIPWSQVERLLVQAAKGLQTYSAARRDRNYRACVVLAFTGMRKGELLALRVRDLDFDSRLIHVRQGKGGKDRAIPMHDRVVVPLRDQRQGKASARRVFDGLTPVAFTGL